MRLILTALIFLLGLFDLFMGLNFLFNPVETAAGFGLLAQGNAGLSSLRADFAAYFCVIAVSMMWGAWRRNGDLLLVPAALMGTTFAVRGFSLAADGAYPGAFLPMSVELVHVVLLIAAWRMLPHHKIAEIAG